jgi:hypothetical protein
VYKPERVAHVRVMQLDLFISLENTGWKEWALSKGLSLDGDDVTLIQEAFEAGMHGCKNAVLLQLQEQLSRHYRKPVNVFSRSLSRCN